MAEKTIVLGISGGIAAYKTPDLVRRLKARGFRVIPVMTEAAQEFVTSTALLAVSSEAVRDDLWDQQAEQGMGHIELARSADLLLVAPATANTIAKFANGVADDLLSTLYLATTAPTLVAPAMNQQMFRHQATQRNLDQLREDGVQVVGPNVGDQACGEFGPGRMSEPHEIVDVVEGLLGQQAVTQPTPNPTRNLNIRALVTAGPTREPIDPVRYLSNASSGRQGYAIATALKRIGAEVTLVSGPVSLESPAGVQRIDVTTTAEMHAVVLSQLEQCNLVFAVAAVADYKPRDVKSQKIKKSSNESSAMALDLVETEDIVKSITAQDDRPFVVGFAAETDDVLENARRKRVRKGLDVIVLNDVSNQEIGFDSSHNAVTLIHSTGETVIPYASKADVADQIVSQVIDLYEDHQAQKASNGSTD